MLKNTLPFALKLTSLLIPVLALAAGCGSESNNDPDVPGAGASGAPVQSAGGKQNVGGGGTAGTASGGTGNGSGGASGSAVGGSAVDGSAGDGAGAGGRGGMSGGSAAGGSSLGGRAGNGSGGNAAGGSSAGGRAGSGGGPTGGAAGTGAAGGNSCGNVMTDAQNCGSCGHACGTGQSCSAGTCTSSGCSAPPTASALLGWAATSGNGVSTTTGGGNATPVTVTTLSEFNSAASGTAAKVIYVTGTISGNMSIGSNKTIAGICGAKLKGHVELSGSVNVIIRNIAIVGYAVGNCALDPDFDSSVGCSSGADAMSVQKDSHHVWIDHCDFSDGTDGNLDITNGADFVTVSWTRFHYSKRTDPVGNDSTGASGHRYSSLVGGSDSKTTDAGKLNVTWHHNHWADNVVERQPRVRFGKNHLFNNLWSAPGGNYCVRAGFNAAVLLQNNVFTGVETPHEFNDTDDQGTANINSVGNTYTSTTGTKATGGGGPAFTTPPYPFTLDAAASVQSAVQSGAGPH